MQRRVRLHQPHLRAPEPRLLDGGVHHAARSPTTSPWAHEPRPRRGERRPRWSPASTPGSPTPAPATPARSIRRRSSDLEAGDRRRRPGRDLRLRADRALARPVRRPAVDRRRRRRSPPAGTRRARASTPSATRSPTTLYRSPADAGAWTRVAHARRAAADAPTDDGDGPRSTLTLTDIGATGAAGAPPAANGAALAPYAQNPNFLRRLDGGGHHARSPPTRRRATRRTPTVITSPLLPAGATFFEGARPGRAALPEQRLLQRLRQGQQLDEYNWIYVAPADGGGCVPIAGVTTCRTTPATWARVRRPARRGSCSATSWATTRGRTTSTRATSPTTTRRCRRPTPGPGRHRSTRSSAACSTATRPRFDRASAPLVQLTHTQIAADARAAERVGGERAGTVTAWLQDGRVHVKQRGHGRGGRARSPAPPRATPTAGQRSGLGHARARAPSR